MRKIVIYPDKVLREKTEKIEEITPQLLEEMKDLKKILSESDIGAGLAAPQIGISKRFFGLKDMESKKIVIHINPMVGNVFGKNKTFVKMVDENTKDQDFLEGCLSFPSFYGTVKRYLRIEARWQELVGEKLVDKKAILEGFEAIVFQHELDHLNGVLFTDRVKEDGGKFFKQMDKEMIPWSVEKVVEQEKEKISNF